MEIERSHDHPPPAHLLLYLSSLPQLDLTLLLVTTNDDQKCSEPREDKDPRVTLVKAVGRVA